MTFHLTKSQIALGLAGAVTTFVVTGLVMHSRAVPVPTSSMSAPPLWAAPVADVPVPQASAQRLAALTPDRQGGPRGACRQDVQWLCGDVARGGGRIAQCLAQHRSEISEGCRAAIQQRRMERQQRHGAASGHPQARIEPSARIIAVPDVQASSVNE